MKKIDVTQALKGLDGEDLTNDSGSGKGTEPLTLKTILVNALLHPANDKDKQGKTIQGETKVMRFQLAQEIYNAGGPLEMGKSDITMIKGLVNEVQPSLITGQVWGMLDSKEYEGPDSVE